MFAFGLYRDGVPSEGVELALGERLLVELAGFRRRRDGVEDAGVRDAGLGVIGNELVPVGSDANAGVARPGHHQEDLRETDRATTGIRDELSEGQILSEKMWTIWG